MKILVISLSILQNLIKKVTQIGIPCQKKRKTNQIEPMSAKKCNNREGASPSRSPKKRLINSTYISNFILFTRFSFLLRPLMAFLEIEWPEPTRKIVD